LPGQAGRRDCHEALKGQLAQDVKRKREYMLTVVFDPLCSNRDGKIESTSWRQYQCRLVKLGSALIVDSERTAMSSPNCGGRTRQDRILAF